MSPFLVREMEACVWSNQSQRGMAISNLSLRQDFFWGGGVPSSTTARVFSFAFTAKVLLKWYTLFDKVGMPTGSFSATVLSTYITWVTFKYEWYLFEYNVNSELLF